MKFAAEKLLGKRIKCQCGKVHYIPTKKIVVDKNIIDQLPVLAKKVCGSKNVTLLADSVTDNIAGKMIEQTFSGQGYNITKQVLPNTHYGKPVVDDKTITFIQRKIDSRTGLIFAVGSGTVNDVAKLVATNLKLPYITFPTAPSMNGYTSSITAIIQNKLKQTVPANPPVAVFCDLNILSNAPFEMVRAGLGDLVSKPMAGADWKLSNLLFNDYWCAWPGKIVDQAEKQCSKAAKEIGQRKPQAIGVLTEGLLLSGISMTIAGSSSPASGGEHLISHYWDITAEFTGRTPNLHGAQVGVATIISAELYEFVRQIDIKNVKTTFLDEHQFKKEIFTHHGKLAKYVFTEATKKYLLPTKKKFFIQKLKDNWYNIWHELGNIIRPANEIRKTLVFAGAPVSARELGISENELKKTILYSHQIRARYNVFDLADDLGVLTKFVNKI